MKNLVSSAFKSLGAMTASGKPYGDNPGVSQQGRQQPVLFCKFSQLHARDLLEMIQNPSNGNSQQIDQISSSTEIQKWKQYYTDLLLKQNELYPDIIDQFEQDLARA